MDKYEIKRVTRDGDVVVQVKCPDCGVWGDVDKDQFFGLVSIKCDCGHHATVNFAAYEHKHGVTSRGKYK